MGNQAGPEAAAGETLCLPDEEKSADDEDPVGAAHQIGETLAHLAAGQALPGEFFLKDGTPAMIWPLLPTDAETLREGFRRPTRRRGAPATADGQDARLHPGG